MKGLEYLEKEDHFQFGKWVEGEGKMHSFGIWGRPWRIKHMCISHLEEAYLIYLFIL